MVRPGVPYLAESITLAMTIPSPMPLAVALLLPCLPHTTTVYGALPQTTSNASAPATVGPSVATHSTCP
jgi:hypothetical protein